MSVFYGKISHIDQPLLLIRCNNYAKTKSKDYYILYLKLYGKELKREEKLDGIVRGYNFIHTEIGEFQYDTLLKSPIRFLFAYNLDNSSLLGK